MHPVIAILVLAPQAGDPPPARTRTLECKEGDTLPIRVFVSTPNRNLLTAVTFPDLIQNVVSSWNDRDLSVEVQGSKLFLKLLSKVEGHLDVVTAGGMHLRLYIRPAEGGQEYDGHLVLKAVPEKTGSEVSQKLPDALELVRAMRLGVVPPGASIKRGGDAAVLATPEVEGKVAFVYETTSYRGYVVRLTNRSAKAAYHLDITRFACPRLVLAGAKSLVVAPEKSTLLYLVLWK